MSPDPDCIFCKIVSGEIPCNKVYEDDRFLGFLDIRPYTKGNALIIPKEHYRWVDDVPDFGAYFEAARKVGLAAKEKLGAFAVSFITLGFEVPHAHIRVVPRYEDDGHGETIDWARFAQFSEDEMREISATLLEATSS